VKVVTFNLIYSIFYAYESNCMWRDEILKHICSPLFLLRYNNQMVSILILPSVVPFNPSVTLSYSTCSYPLFLMKGND